ncbi:MAG: replication factor C small subunit [Candidatus Micrarchaeota archaeon]|nr:replication factor C small subunit [Candidatus Micrarchaeota archaeon]
MLPWVEKYRPKKLDEVVGQDNIVALMKSFLKKKNMPHLLFAGPPGVGKTTVALAFANELFKGELAGNFLELNASDERGIDVIREKVKEFARTLPQNDVGFKILFLDEADALTPEAQQALRRMMEVYSKHTRFILSCNYPSKIIEPIQSRVSILRFQPLSKEDIKKLVEKIAKEEKLKIDPEVIDYLYEVSEGDTRKILNILQGAAYLDKHITLDNVKKVSGMVFSEEMKDIVELLRKGDFKKAREQSIKLMTEYGVSGEEFLTSLYRAILKMDIPDEEKARYIKKIAEYNHRIVEGANERIQVDALLSELLSTKDSGH